jgi:hypothetical protein
MELKGRRVDFAIKDIYFPAPGTVLDELHGDDLISGQIVDVSDSGFDPEAFVVVKVDKLDVPGNATSAMVGFNLNANKLATATVTGLYGR